MNIVVVTYVQAVAAVKPGGRGSLVQVFFADAVTEGVDVLRGEYRLSRGDLTAFFRWGV